MSWVSRFVRKYDPVTAAVVKNDPTVNMLREAEAAGNWGDPFGDEKSGWDVLGAGEPGQITSGGKPVGGAASASDESDRDAGRAVGTVVGGYFAGVALAGGEAGAGAAAGAEGGAVIGVEEGLAAYTNIGSAAAPAAAAGGGWWDAVGSTALKLATTAAQAKIAAHYAPSYDLSAPALAPGGVPQFGYGAAPGGELLSPAALRQVLLFGGLGFAALIVVMVVKK